LLDLVVAVALSIAIGNVPRLRAADWPKVALGDLAELPSAAPAAVPGAMSGSAKAASPAE
jgi:hypothetical protein